MRLSAPDKQMPDLDAINLMESRFYANEQPHAVWDYLREHRPVYGQGLPDGSGFWVVTRYHDVRRVLRNHHEFSSRHGTMLSIIDVGLADIASDVMMPDSDPPVHGRLREPVARALAMRVLEQHEARIRQIVRGLLEPALSGEAIDLAAAALLFPMAFTGLLMGVPEADWPSMARATTRTIAYDDPDYEQGNPLATLRSAHHELFAAFSAEIERRRRRHREPDGYDIIDILLSMTVEGQQLTAEQTLMNCYAVLLGANVTTPHAATATVLALAGAPDQYDRLAEHPDLIASCVEEGLRYSSPAMHFMRYSTMDVELGGETIPAGNPVSAWIASANRDGSVFDRPHEFLIDRNPNPHVAFGFGPHYCVGAALARVALNALLSELVRVAERIELVGPVTHLRSTFVAGFKHATIRLIPRERPLDLTLARRRAVVP